MTVLASAEEVERLRRVIASKPESQHAVDARATLRRWLHDPALEVSTEIRTAIEAALGEESGAPGSGAQ